MNDTRPRTRPQEPARYAIRVAGLLDQRWASWFDGLTVTQHSDGSTVLDGPVVDQAALHGLLQRIRDLGLPLLSVTPAPPATTDTPPATTDTPPDTTDTPPTTTATTTTTTGSPS
jgi:hypothetical protein